jgi:hypothetical protein
MRTLLFGLIAFTAAPLAQAAGQRGSQPTLVLTILGGTVAGHSLWSVAKQPLCVGATACTSQYDTLRIGRSVGSSLVLGASGTYFPSPHVGVHLEISYLGLPVDSDCTALFLNPDAENKNEQICNDIQAQAANGGAIAIFGGATFRVAPRRSFSPYLRANFGIVNQSHSTVEVVGGYQDGSGTFFDRQVVVDNDPHRNSLLLGGAVGFTSPVGSGYQFRFEVRDLVTSLNRLTGPANALGVGPTATRNYHHVALVIGFDVVLEQSRGRRY